jgi:hypothetical protein
VTEHRKRHRHFARRVVLNASFSLKDPCGFTFQVQQQRGKDLGGSLEVEAFPLGVIMTVSEGVDAALRQQVRLDVSGQQTAQPSEGVFDAAFLPRRVDVAEVGLHVQAGVQLLVARELRAVAPRKRGDFW